MRRLFAGRSRELTVQELKGIALITMLIDHLGVGLMEPWMMAGHWQMPIVILHLAMRLIGRIAFPLYIFCLLEGFAHTRSRLRYFLRLLAAALITEPFFDIGFSLTWEELASGKLVDFAYQNVIFTLAIGFAAISLMDLIRTWRPRRRGQESVFSPEGILRLLLELAVLAGLAYFCEAMEADYGLFGVGAIGAGYLAGVYGPRLFPGLSGNRLVFLAAVAVLILGSRSEIVGLAGLPLVSAYRGERGNRAVKWFFYASYPLHIALIGLLRMHLSLAPIF